jgi:5-carboxymethyl-2-hydroxymuconate isomerase
MKTLAYALLTFALLRLFDALPAQAQDSRRPTEAMTVAAYEADAIAKARQRPDVIRLRFALAKATTEAERKAISASLYAILEGAAAQGRQAGLAAVEQRRRADADLHRKWDEDRRHSELINALQNLRR